MADDNSLKLFGFEISRARNEKKKEQLPSIVPPLDDDGAGYVTAAGSHYGSYVDLTGEQAKDDIAATVPEADKAIESLIEQLPSNWDAVFLHSRAKVKY